MCRVGCRGSTGSAQNCPAANSTGAGVLAKEYSAPLGWTLPIVAVGIYNLQSNPAAASHVIALLVVLAVAIALWLTAGFLKRTHSPLMQATDG
jgi:hypothetical protein